jgi:colanic acid/amylovoran biosynthesis glycosyltransferase
MVSALRAEDAKLLHIYFGHVGVHLLPLIEISPIPVIVSFHGADGGVDLEKPAHLAATCKMLSVASRILARSESLAKQLVALGCSPEKLHIHRTGLPFEEFAFSQRIAPTDGAWRCVQACRLISKKGLATSLRAFASFQKKFPRASFTIAGEGPLREELKALAESLGVADRVFFTGFVSQAKLRALYAEAHLFLHPSETSADGDREGVPNSMLEAMAAGVPPLATHHGGIPEAVEHGVSGLLVAEGDADALAAEMLALAEHPERYAAMSVAAAQRVRRQFDLEEQTRALEEIYRKTIAAAHAHAQAAVGSASKAQTSSSVV